MNMAPDTNLQETDSRTDSQGDQALAKRIVETIKADKIYHSKAFKQMRRDMFMAMEGRDAAYSEDQYKANFLGRHVKMKTASLYAKNPKAVATRAERLDFEIWDENPETLQLAFLTIQEGMQALQIAQSQSATDPITGQTAMPTPQLPPGFDEARALVEDYKRGTEYRQHVDRVGKTLEILFAKALRDQEPLDFKTAAKKLVRRACTTGVGYVELGFLRETEPDPSIENRLADTRARIEHLERLAKDAASGEMDADSPEISELQHALQALMDEPEIVVREGLTFDFPASTKVIPDKLCKSLVGFVGARHLTIEYLFTVKEIQEIFPGADIKTGFTGYRADGKSLEQPTQAEIPFDSEKESDEDAIDNDELVCVWKHYDKPSGLVYYVADGFKGMLRDPAPPDVFVEKFWPVFALTFNEVESEDVLFPPSDVYLLADQQREHNRSRQGMREHRQAARPRWVTRAGMFEDDDVSKLQNSTAFDVAVLNLDPAVPIAQALEAMPVPGVDMNLYETGQFFSDTQLVAGTQHASYGGVSKATATESAIAANSTASSDGSSTDDLDSFLSAVARAGSQILLREMSEEQVRAIVGPGAMWPKQSLADIANELFLEVEAGSSGRPNQAVEIDNLTKIMPFLIQMPNINHSELAREVLRRMDDRLDLTKMITANTPSIVMQNQMAQPGTGDPATDPGQQGAAGGDNAPTAVGVESPGTGPAFGSNQV